MYISTTSNIIPTRITITNLLNLIGGDIPAHYVARQTGVYCGSENECFGSGVCFDTGNVCLGSGNVAKTWR